MGRGEFDEILEECLSALLEGRRSILESLSLYPAWRGRLEPLLKAAEEIAAGLDHVPPAYVRERGLQRFLESARARRRLRALIPLGRESVPWWRWVPSGVAAVAVIGALLLMSETLMAEKGRTLNPASVSVSPYREREAPDAADSAPVTPLERVQRQVGLLESSIRDGGPVEMRVLEELGAASEELAADLEQSPGIVLIERAAAVSTVSRQYELLRELKERSSGLEARVVEEGLAAAAVVLETLGATPTPEPEGSATTETDTSSPTPGQPVPIAGSGATPVPSAPPTSSQ